MPQRPDPVDIGLGLRIFPVRSAQEVRAEQDEQQAIQQDREITRMKLSDYIADRQAKAAQAKAKQDEDAFLSDSLRRHTVDGKPDFDAVVKEAYTKYPDLAFTLEERLAKGRSSMVDARMKDIDEKKKRMDLGKTYLDRIVDPQTFAINAPLIAEVDPELAQTLGPQFNPELIGKLHEGYPTEVQKLDRAKAYYGSSDIRSGILFDLAHADDPEDYEATLKAAEELLPRSISKVIRQQFGTDTPETRQQIQTILDADQKADKSPNSQSEEFLLNGQRVKGDYVPGTGGQPGRYFYQGKDVTGQARGIPPASQGGGAAPTATNMPAPAKAVIARVITGLPSTRVGPIVSEANRLAATGDEDALRSYLKYAATRTVGEARQEVMRGRVETLSALKDAESLLKEVPTNYLKGTWEDTARFLGTTSDPRLVELGTRMGTILANYMRSISGAAVADKEAERLGKLIPNYRNTLTVNLGQLKGFSDALKSFDAGFYQNTFGEHYDWVMGGKGGASGGGDADVTVSRDAKGNLIIKRGG